MRISPPHGATRDLSTTQISSATCVGARDSYFGIYGWRGGGGDGEICKIDGAIRYVGVLIPINCVTYKA